MCDKSIMLQELGIRNWELEYFCAVINMFKKLINIEVLILFENLSNIIWNIVIGWTYG